LLTEIILILIPWYTATQGHAQIVRGVQTVLIMGVTRGAQFPGAESLWGRRMTGGRRKVSTMSQVLSSIQYICFRKISGSNMGAPNLLLALGAT